MKSAYTLLPSRAYFNRLRDPLILPLVEFSTTTPVTQNFRDIYGNSISDYDTLRKFLRGENGTRTEPSSNDVNTPNVLKENFEALKKATDYDNQPFEVIKMPMPHMKYDNGKKAPVSYINGYIGNTVVLVETFNDPNDTKAIETWQSLFPDRKVVPIDCREIIYGGGALHCMSQQQPSPMDLQN